MYHSHLVHREQSALLSPVNCTDFWHLDVQYQGHISFLDKVLKLSGLSSGDPKPRFQSTFELMHSISSRVRNF